MTMFMFELWSSCRVHNQSFQNEIVFGKMLFYSIGMWDNTTFQNIEINCERNDLSLLPFETKGQRVPSMLTIGPKFDANSTSIIPLPELKELRLDNIVVNNLHRENFPKLEQVRYWTRHHCTLAFLTKLRLYRVQVSATDMTSPLNVMYSSLLVQSTYGPGSIPMRAHITCQNLPSPPKICKSDWKLFITVLL